MSQTKLVALLDANVLYPATLRDLLIWLAVCEAYHAHWTPEITREWTKNLLKDRQDLSATRLERTLSLMDNALPYANLTGYENHIAALKLPDPNDRHVLAAAIHVGADVIVTQNLRDFPSTILEPLGIRAVHPDDFICGIKDTDSTTVLTAVVGQRANFKNPKLTLEEYFARLSNQGLPQFVIWLQSVIVE
jgi:predicted nucleic acid-binding protein